MEPELRDQFAIGAMQGFLFRRGSMADNGQILVENIAGSSYKIADAMMRARAIPPAPVPSSQLPKAPVHRKSLKRKVWKEIIQEVIDLKKSGLTNKQIAEKFDVNGQSVNGIIQIARHQNLIPKKG